MPDDDGMIRRAVAAAFTRLRDEQCGMTLVEAMVAAMLLMIGICLLYTSDAADE